MSKKQSNPSLPKEVERPNPPPPPPKRKTVKLFGMEFYVDDIVDSNAKIGKLI